MFPGKTVPGVFAPEVSSGGGGSALEETPRSPLEEV
jgi:hypothetical protein